MRLFPHRPRLTHAQAKRVAWAFFISAVLVELGICTHAFSVRDAVTGSLVVSAWTREYLFGLIEHLAADV
jgi:hypothetical protein